MMAGRISFDSLYFSNNTLQHNCVVKYLSQILMCIRVRIFVFVCVCVCVCVCVSALCVCLSVFLHVCFSVSEWFGVCVCV